MSLKRGGLLYLAVRQSLPRARRSEKPTWAAKKFIAARLFAAILFSFL
jgi:hypothetical protein